MVIVAGAFQSAEKSAVLMSVRLVIWNKGGYGEGFLREMLAMPSSSAGNSQ
ncbi:MAG: hypothetical protein K1X90_10060 [Candidatus Kapabacteria bacterium]|nr:hypothetical protein [Candidatus Kapabacteria bacterium]